MDFEGFLTVQQRTPLAIAEVFDPLGGADAETVRWLLVATAAWWLWLALAAVLRSLGWWLWQRLRGRAGVRFERTWWLSGLPLLSLVSAVAPLAGWLQLHRRGELVLAWWTLAVVAQALAVLLRSLRIEVLWLDVRSRELVQRERAAGGQLATHALPWSQWSAELAEPPGVVALLGSLAAARAYLRWARQRCGATV